MQCYRLVATGIEGIVLAEHVPPPPGPGQILVRMLAASLNYRDLLGAERFDSARDQPFIPFSDGIGEVIAVGPGVRRFGPGDRVASCFYPDWIYGEPARTPMARSLGGGGTDGVLCRQRLFDEQSVVPAPAGLSSIEVATLPCAALTAWNAIGTVRTGESVLIQGTGGVSIFALQFAKAAGARVIALSSSDEKIARLRALGADETINYRSDPDWSANVLELTGGRGVDRIVEIGGPSTLTRSIASVAWGGEINLIGTLSQGQIDPRPIMSASAIVRGIRVGSRAMFEAMNQRIEQTGLRPVIDSVFDFSEVIAAFRHLKSGRHFGKIVIELG